MKGIASLIKPASNLLHGVLPVLHTPLDTDGSIDVPTLERQIDWAFEVGAQGVVIAMVSEVLRLGYHGRKELASYVCRAVQGRGFTVISVGAESIKESLDFAHHAQELGASAVMAIPPVSISLGSAQTAGYFAAIARGISIPLVVQDASSYVGAAIDLSVYLNLLDEFGEERIFSSLRLVPSVRISRNCAMRPKGVHASSRAPVGSIWSTATVAVLSVLCLGRIFSTVSSLFGTHCKMAMMSESINYRSPSGALTALQLQAGLDGFLAIEKYLLKKRGLFPNTLQVEPYGWQLDSETCAEVDRLFAWLERKLVENR